jgi:uncharacterized phage protein gp47/JayE
MPWATPTLKQVRITVRDYVLAALGGVAMIPNSGLRIMSDAQAGLTHLTLLYLDWLAKQLMPDTAETEWLDRHGNIWLTNADGTKGRKAATYATGTITVTGINGTLVPQFTEFAGANQVSYQTQADVIIGSGPTDVAVEALTAGLISNMETGSTISAVAPLPGMDDTATIVTMDGGVDTESDDDLRARVLFRIQNPPMGGDASDYIAWALAVPGVTRAWSYPNEMGVGTMTVRFLMDDLRADNHGLPEPGDIVTVADYIDKVRPVTVKDCYVVAPLLYFYDLTINNLVTNDAATQAQIEASLKTLEHDKSQPGQTWYRSWVDEAISDAPGESSHELIYDTQVMPGNGYMPILGTITYGP